MHKHKLQLPNNPITANAELLGVLCEPPPAGQGQLTNGVDNGIAAVRLSSGDVAISNDVRETPYVNGKPRPASLVGSEHNVGDALQENPRAQALWHLFDVPMPIRFDAEGYPRLTATAVRIYSHAAHHQGMQGQLVGVSLPFAGDQRPVEIWRLALGALNPDAFESVMELRQFVAHLRWNGHAGISVDDERLLVKRWQVWHEDVASGQLMQGLFGVVL